MSTSKSFLLPNKRYVHYVGHVCLISAVALASLFISADVFANSFRCNSYVIEPGMRKIELMQKCGTPATASSRIERRIVRVKQKGQATTYPYLQNPSVVEVERETEITIEEWIYNFGPNQFMQQVIMEDGRIKEIIDLGYGR